MYEEKDRKRQLIESAHTGDKAARDLLVEENTGLVWSVVRRFLNRGQEAEDLFQIGVIGLMKAIDKFDVSFDVQFSTYAVPMIIGEIKRFLRDDGIVKVSRSLKEQGYKISLAKEKIRNEQGREATFEEITAETGLTPEEITLALEANREVESIYQAVPGKDGTECYLVDKIVSTGGMCKSSGGIDYGEDKEKEMILNRLLLSQLLSDLDEREKTLIQMRYFKEKTQTQVAKVLNISQVQVSRMESKILKRLREKINQS
ncbi:MAG: SigB/SigF/SigG family RNA polymerase sigma factor [Lachnospiraceae bacterium]|nr:SigB/SigF/SigG family RNA polymerase sigma factor [Lachnospiraceae bacterium]